MIEAIIKVQVTDRQAAFFVGRDMMVTPLSGMEAEQLAIALRDMGDLAPRLVDAFELLHGTVKTVAEGVRKETGQEFNPLPGFVGTLIEECQGLVERVEYVRVLLGRSALVGPDDSKVVMQ